MKVVEVRISGVFFEYPGGKAGITPAGGTVSNQAKLFENLKPDQQRAILAYLNRVHCTSSFSTSNEAGKQEVTLS